MNIFYKNFLKIESIPISVIIILFSVTLSLFSFGFASYCFDEFLETYKVIDIIIYIALIPFSYFLFNFFNLASYQDIYQIKEKIILEKETLKNIITWTYTKEESSSFKKEYFSSLKKGEYSFLQVILIPLSIPLIIILIGLGKEELSIIFHCIIFFTIIILGAFNEYNDKEKALYNI